MNEPDNLNPDSLYDSMLRQTKQRGELMARDLSKALPSIGLSPELLNNHPVICLDVGEGAEIVALGLFYPSHIFVSESFEMEVDKTEFFSNEDTQKAMAKVIGTLSRNRPVTLIRLPAEQALIQLKQQDPPIKTNLITCLNAHPSQLEAAIISALISHSVDSLNIGGVFLMTAQEPEELPIFQEVANIPIQGFSLKTIPLGDETSALTSIGSHALVATKLQN